MFTFGFETFETRTALIAAVRKVVRRRRVDSERTARERRESRILRNADNRERRVRFDRKAHEDSLVLDGLSASDYYVYGGAVYAREGNAEV